MTTLTPDPPDHPATYRDLLGTAGYIADHIDTYRRTGQLLRFDQPVEHHDGTYTIRVYLRPQPTLPSTKAVEPHRWTTLDYLAIGAPIATTTLTTGVVATLGWGIYELASAAATHAEHVLPAAAAGAVFWVVSAVGGTAAACAGLHCAGCRG
jgi:hypothetical protein